MDARSGTLPINRAPPAQWQRVSENSRPSQLSLSVSQQAAARGLRVSAGDEAAAGAARWTPRPAGGSEEISCSLPLEESSSSSKVKASRPSQLCCTHQRLQSPMLVRSCRIADMFSMSLTCLKKLQEREHASRTPSEGGPNHCRQQLTNHPQQQRPQG